MPHVNQEQGCSGEESRDRRGGLSSHEWHHTSRTSINAMLWLRA
jgi:hypothetical protein